MTIYLCVHGHAYQPPREDPATGEVALQPSAAPYHDWNDRITDECYRPFGAAKVLAVSGGDGPADGVAEEINLWGTVSFDLGPTLGVWMDRQAPDVAEVIAAGDAAGAGAMAHPWVHAILPLTPHRDRATVIRWGIAEYEGRFGRLPTGMWLPETAVDTASLEALVDAGIEWTLLAPHQVRRVDVGADDSGELVDPGHRPLVVSLPSGRSIVAVPYDGGLSHGIAFDGLLKDGVALAESFIDAAKAADTTGSAPPLIVAATDLETFGHHHRFGEMALAKAVQVWRSHPAIELITPERYLEQFGTAGAGVLVERTSWSCAHGIERWRSNCGCRFEEVEGQDQTWRRPLRDDLDALEDVARRLLDGDARQDLRDPWAARDDYGSVLGARPEQVDVRRREFLERHLAPGGDERRALDWMEAERLRLEAWSSCAWFFDSLDRIETQQVLAEAAAALDRYPRPPA